MAPSHYLNQYSLIISEVLWHKHTCCMFSFPWNAQAISTWYGHWVKSMLAYNSGATYTCSVLFICVFSCHIVGCKPWADGLRHAAQYAGYPRSTETQHGEADSCSGRGFWVADICLGFSEWRISNEGQKRKEKTTKIYYRDQERFTEKHILLTSSDKSCLFTHFIPG